MNTYADIHSYKPNITVDGKKVTQVINIYPRFFDRNEYTMTLYILEENGKQGLYRASKEGLVQLTPAEYEIIDVKQNDNNIYIRATDCSKTYPVYSIMSAALCDVYHYDFFEGNATMLVKDVYCPDELDKKIPHIYIFTHGDKTHTIINTATAQVLYKNVKEISRFTFDYQDGLLLLKKELLNNGNCDRLIKLTESGLDNSYDRTAEEIQFFGGHQIVFAFKDNGKFSFQKRDCYGQLIDMKTKLDIIDLIVVKQELEKDPQMDFSDFEHMNKMQKQHLANAPDILIVTQNKEGKKAIASVDENLKYKLITDYIFDDIKYKSTKTPACYQYEFLPEDHEELSIDYWGLNPIEVEFEATKDGKTQAVTYYAELNKVKKTGSHQSMWLYNNIKKEGYTPLRPFTPKKPKPQPAVSSDVESDLPF